MIKNKLLLSLCCLYTLVNAESMDSLLQDFRTDSELSKITKIESAGFVDIYTREDLEQMQVRTLLDVLKSLTTHTITRTSNNLTAFSKTTVHMMPLPAIKLYINGHDVTSTSSGRVIWADMPIEHIDHIEIYKAAASIEFSNEPGTAIIKIYTKNAEREEGGKLRVTTDQKGSYGLDTYYAHTTLDDLSYFLYATKNDIKRENYYNDGYKFDSDKSTYNLYANIIYKDWNLELSRYYKENDDFLGIGTNKTPVDGGVDANQNYIHISKEFDNNLKIQAGYDYIDYALKYTDDNDITIGITNPVNSYYTNHKDSIFYLIADKKINFEDNELLIGAFHKYKRFNFSGTYDLQQVNFKNTLNISSAYIENNYNIYDSTMLVASLKVDYYNYDKEIESKTASTSRIGLIKNIDNLQIKAFATKSYYPAEFYKLYNEGNNQIITNKNLDFPDIYIYMASLNYKTDNYEVELRTSQHTFKKHIMYTSNGLQNIDIVVKNQFYSLKQTYHFNNNNKILLDIFTGDNNRDLLWSPKYGINIRTFTNFGKWNIYNELIMKSDYEIFGIDVDNSIDYTAAIKYTASSNFSVGIRGENIFDKGYEQAYKNLPYSIPVTDQKIWINLEYLF